MQDRTERAAKRAGVQSAHDKQVEMWRELRHENFQHWRAWGSWFSWGSPVGLGLFFVLLALAAAILMWAIALF